MQVPAHLQPRHLPSRFRPCLRRVFLHQPLQGQECAWSMNQAASRPAGRASLQPQGSVCPSPTRATLLCPRPALQRGLYVVGVREGWQVPGRHSKAGLELPRCAGPDSRGRLCQGCLGTTVSSFCGCDDLAGAMLEPGRGGERGSPSQVCLPRCGPEGACRHVRTHTATRVHTCTHMPTCSLASGDSRERLPTCARVHPPPTIPRLKASRRVTSAKVRHTQPAHRHRLWSSPCWSPVGHHLQHPSQPALPVMGWLGGAGPFPSWAQWPRGLQGRACDSCATSPGHGQMEGLEGHLSPQPEAPRTQKGKCSHVACCLAPVCPLGTGPRSRRQ